MLSTASAVSARGQTEEEAALNVREWIREADYALEVRAEQSERKEKAGASECLNVSVHAFLVGLCVVFVYDCVHIFSNFNFMHVFVVGLCVLLHI